LNKNIKKYLRFSVRAKHRKMLSTENSFLKNDFSETILRRNKRSIRVKYIFFVGK
jgi:uncharacterized membrane protein YukC